MLKNILKLCRRHGLTVQVECGTLLLTGIKRRSPFCEAHVSEFHISTQFFNKKSPESAVVVVSDFERNSVKTKDSYIDMIRLYESRQPQRRGHVEFIYAALKHMHEYGVEKDLDVYKSLMDVMPKGKMVARNVIQTEFMHYPKQQRCMLALLEQMEDNGVIPDVEMESMLLNTFGKNAHPLRKYWRMMYWMPKFKNLSPWRVPNPVPDDALELAKLAIERITSADLRTEISVYHGDDVIDSIDKTWIVSGMSPVQIDLINKHPESTPVIVEGGSRVWLRSRSVNYFVLKKDGAAEDRASDIDTDDVSNIRNPFFNTAPEKNKIVPAKTVHEQDDGTIYAVCATGSSSKDSALSWVRILQKHKAPILEKAPILFRFRTPSGELVPFSEAVKENDDRPDR